MAHIVEMPKLGFDMAEGKLARWVIAEQKSVQKGQVLAEIETDKATVEVESSFSGVVVKHLAQEGQALPIGAPIAVIAETDEQVDLEKLLADQAVNEDLVTKSTPAPVEVASETQPDTSKSESEDDWIKASPVAKRIAEEKKIDLAHIKGSGPDGRIVKRDVEAAAKDAATQTAATFDEADIVHGQDKTGEVSKLRATIGKRMTESRQTIPHFYITSMYDVAEMLKTRQQLNKDLPDDARVSVNDFIVRAVALSLRSFPNLNTSISGTKLTLHADINIGVAVALENGLLTVVVKNADQKPLKQISMEVKDMVQRLKDGKVRNEDIEGSTFTISNLGMYQVEDFVAIINPPEAAILAVASAKEIPIIKEGVLDIGTRMKATISADHRITDGAEAAAFMQHLALFIEQPWRLFA